jgi:hypothetical protein
MKTLATALKYTIALALTPLKRLPLGFQNTKQITGKHSRAVGVHRNKQRDKNMTQEQMNEIPDAAFAKVFGDKW